MSNMFRVVGFVGAGIVAGFLLGGVGPRRELDDLSAELKDVKRKLERMDRPNPLRELLPGLTQGRFERGPARRPDTQAEPDRKGAAPGADAQNAGPDSAGRAGASGGAVIIRGTQATGPSAAQATRQGANDGAEGEPWAPEPDPEATDEEQRRRGFRELNLARFDEISTAQALRFAASRAALIEQAGLDEKETAAVDQTVKKMNDELSGYGEEILSQVSAEEPPAPSQALGLGHDVSGIMYDGQKRLESIVGERADGVEPEALQIWNYVDMKRLRPAAEKYLPANGKVPSAAAPGTTSGATTTPTTGTPKPGTSSKDDE